MQFPDLANTTSALIRSDLTSAGLEITPNTEVYLEALKARTRCWSGIFTATAAWLSTADVQEQAVAWSSIVKICNQDGRPHAAMSRLYFFRENTAALKTLWQALPAGTVSDLQVALAANPLLLAMFSDPSSGVTGLPAPLSNTSEAASIWTRVRHKMEKLSRFENPRST